MLCAGPRFSRRVLSAAMVLGSGSERAARGHLRLHRAHLGGHVLTRSLSLLADCCRQCARACSHHPYVPCIPIILNPRLVDQRACLPHHVVGIRMGKQGKHQHLHNRGRFWFAFRARFCECLLTVCCEVGTFLEHIMRNTNMSIVGRSYKKTSNELRMQVLRTKESEVVSSLA